MAISEFTLKHGLTIGETTHKSVKMKEITAGDILDATEESEKIVSLPTGEHTLVASPVLVGINVLRRQVASIGDYPGPLSLAEIRKLHPDDLDIIQAKAGILESVTIEVARRGRDETPIEGAD